MKILIVGDFHGKLSGKVFSKIKREDPDCVFSSGDFCGNNELGKMFFKYIYGKSEESVSLNIRKRIEFLENIAFKSGISVVKKLGGLGKKVFAVMGNWDPAPYGQDIRGRATGAKDKKMTRKMQNADSNVKFIDMKLVEFPEFVLVGGASTSSPGILSKKTLKRIVRWYGKSEARDFKKNYDWRERKYKKLFSKANKIKKRTGRPIIFLTHNCPYNTMLDKIRLGEQRGRHYGSYLERKMIERYQPDYVFCGHMHENPGQCMIGKSLVINPGSVLDGKFKVLKI